MKKISRLLISLVLVYFIAFLGSYFTFPSIGGWYAGLNKPIFNPPNWIFGPVWSTLYFLMAISFSMIWEKNYYFFGQLILNFLWSFLFFGLHQPLLAFFDIVLLWIFIFLTIVGFYKKSKIAAYLLIPYLLWVSFASILNISIVLLN